MLNSLTTKLLKNLKSGVVKLLIELRYDIAEIIFFKNLKIIY